MNIQITLNKKFLVFSLVIGLLVVGFVGVYAYNSAGAPSLMGHSVNEIDWSQTIQKVNAAEVCIGSDCRTAWPSAGAGLLAGNGIILTTEDGGIRISATGGGGGGGSASMDCTIVNGGASGLYTSITATCPATYPVATGGSCYLAEGGVSGWDCAPSGTNAWYCASSSAKCANVYVKCCKISGGGGGGGASTLDTSNVILPGGYTLQSYIDNLTSYFFPAWDYVNSGYQYSAGSVTLVSFSNIATTNFAKTVTKVREAVLGTGGTVRISSSSMYTGGNHYAYAYVYRNGNQVAQLGYAGNHPISFSQDVSGWSAGDKLQIYIKSTHNPESGKSINIQNLKVGVAELPTIPPVNPIPTPTTIKTMD